MSPARRDALRLARRLALSLAAVALLARTGLFSGPAGHAATSTLTIVHSFAPEPYQPKTALVFDGAGRLYGTTSYGGAFQRGAVYAVQADGTGFAVVYSFQGEIQPVSALALDSGNLYGTAFVGAKGFGAVYTVRTDGTGFRVIHDFAGAPTEGSLPLGGVTFDPSGFLYGTTQRGGTLDLGTIYRVRTDGTAFSVLHHFAGGLLDGSFPAAAPARDGSGNLFGTTHSGGALDVGTVFTLRTDGSGFALLKSFDGPQGQRPQSPLALDASRTLYGTAYGGGAANGGTVFRLRPDGSGFLTLKEFAGGPLDGLHPLNAGVVLDGSGNLYGATVGGGPANVGTVFSMKTDGSAFALLHSFAGAPADGNQPYASLVLAGGALYGTTYLGGSDDLGTVFGVSTDGSDYGVFHAFRGSSGRTPQGSLAFEAPDKVYGTTIDRGPLDPAVLYSVRTDGSGFAILHVFQSAITTSGLALGPSGALYGAAYGSTFGYGVLFRIRTDGTGFTTLHAFTGGAMDGALPTAPPLLDPSGTLLGTTFIGGSSNLGVVYAVATDGSGFRILHSFAGGAADGANPRGALVRDGAGLLYGTTATGGTSGFGTVFRVRSDGAGFTLLHAFDGTLGKTPQGPLALDGTGRLYGTTLAGGASGRGTVFRLGSDGAGFAVLRSFAGIPADGDGPLSCAPLLDAGRLLGTTGGGGTAGRGAFFSMAPDGTGYAVMSVPGAPGVGQPYGSLVRDAAGNAYGTSLTGGDSDYGTVFKLASEGPPPPTPTPTPVPPTPTPPIPARYHALTPCRILDTRAPDGPLGGPALAAGAARDFTVAGACGVPAAAKALAVNVTVTQPAAPGYLAMWAAGTPDPGTSTVRYRAGQTRAVAAVVAPAASGRITMSCRQPSGTAHVVLDVAGYFQ